MKLYCDQSHKYWYEQIYSPYYLNSPHNSKHMFDIYTLTHIFWGIIMALTLDKLLWIHFHNKNKLTVFIALLIFKILFEVYENMPEQIKKYNRIETDSNGNTTYRGDTFINSFGDIVSGMIGVYIGLYYKKLSIILLFISFILITRTVGFSYWTDFFSFLFKF